MRREGGGEMKTNNGNHRLPSFARRYFWDVDARKLDADKYAGYVIERLLELGDLQAVRWLLQKYSRRRIVAVLKKTRSLSKPSANFWALYFRVPRNEIRCLSKHYQKQLSAVWQY